MHSKQLTFLIAYAKRLHHDDITRKNITNKKTTLELSGNR